MRSYHIASASIPTSFCTTATSYSRPKRTTGSKPDVLSIKLIYVGILGVKSRTTAPKLQEDARPPLL